MAGCLVGQAESCGGERGTDCTFFLLVGPPLLGTTHSRKTAVSGLGFEYPDFQLLELTRPLTYRKSFHGKILYGISKENHANPSSFVF